jgi:hypothetical protein
MIGHNNNNNNNPFSILTLIENEENPEQEKEEKEYINEMDHKREIGNLHWKSKPRFVSNHVDEAGPQYSKNVSFTVIDHSRYSRTLMLPNHLRKPHLIRKFLYEELELSCKEKLTLYDIHGTRICHFDRSAFCRQLTLSKFTLVTSRNLLFRYHRFATVGSNNFFHLKEKHSSSRNQREKPQTRELQSVVPSLVIRRWKISKKRRRMVDVSGRVRRHHIPLRCPYIPYVGPDTNLCTPPGKIQRPEPPPVVEDEGYHWLAGFFRDFNFILIIHCYIYFYIIRFSVFTVGYFRNKSNLRQNHYLYQPRSHSH